MSESDKSFDEIIEKCFKLCETTSAKTENVYNKLYNIIYSSENDYIHHYPRTLILQITSKCNLRCKHCFFYNKPEKYSSENDLSEREIFEQVKYFVEEVNILHCTITGGEVFTSSLTLKIIKYLKEHAVTIKIVTNGTLITEEIAKEIGTYLNPKYDIIQVSLDGAHQETNDSIRGNGVFNKVLSSINNLVKYNCNVEIGMTVNSKNISELSDMYKLARNTGVKSLNIGKINIENETQEYLNPDLRDIFINVAKLNDIYDEKIKLCIACLKVPDFLNFTHGQELLDDKLASKNFCLSNLHCKPHHQQVALFANGNIAHCYNCNITDVILGNIKTKSFDEIWKNRFKSPMFQKRMPENHLCKKCKYLSICYSGCPYRAYEKYGTILAPGLECKYLERISSGT